MARRNDLLPFESGLKTKKHSCKQVEELVEGRDYYLEGSNMVFTADLLRRRGYCCESGCRHCPYGFGPEGLKRRLSTPERNQAE